MSKTIREMLNEWQSEILNKDLAPDRAAEILVSLASIYGNINEQILKTEMAFNRLLNDALNTNEKANRATIRAKTTKEYENWRIAVNSEKELLALIRSINRLLKVKETEQQSSKYQ